MLHTPSLLALFTAKLISTCGSWLTTLALPWFVLATTGSPAKMGLVLTVEFLGVGLAGLPSGKLVARWGARRTMLICDAARVPLMALIPLLHHADRLSLPVLLVISFGLGTFTTPYVSSQRLILPELLGAARGEDERFVAQANSLIDAATRIAALAGPAVGGVLIASLGAAQVLWVDAGTYLVSFLILAVFVRPAPISEPAAHQADTEPGEGPSASMFTGLRYTLRSPTLRPFVLALILLAIAVPAVFICLPVLVLQNLDGNPRTLGLLTAANGTGLAVGSLVAVTTLSRIRRPALIIAAVVQCLPLFLLLAENVIAIAAGLFLAGLATPILAAMVNTRVTLGTPVPLRPHVLTAVSTTENVAALIGFSSAGPLLQVTGPQPVLCAIASLATLGAGCLIFALHSTPSSPAVSTEPATTAQAAG
jgi:predicted MFS family arabinose efflux permease